MSRDQDDSAAANELRHSTVEAGPTEGAEAEAQDEANIRASVDAAIVARGTRRVGEPRRVVDTDVELHVYGLEDADGSLGVPIEFIKDALHGMHIWIDGYKFVLAIANYDTENISRFWTDDELLHE